MSVDAVLIAGPTASGKSALALALAERIGGAVVNADSMQVYREVRVLTARPGPEDEARVPHRLYGHVSVGEAYSVARFQAEAAAAFRDERAKGRVPIFVGGTGLYFAALTQGLADIPPVPKEIRLAVAERRAALGPEAFFGELRLNDPVAAARLRASDTQRVTRAYEVFAATGRPLSEWQRAETARPPLDGSNLIRMVLAPSRAELYRRIDRRFDAMLAAGALGEAAALKELPVSQPAAKILGLRELSAALSGQVTVEAARTAAQTATRHYAKRQLTWFRHRMKDWTWTGNADTRNFLTQILGDFT